MSMDEEKKTGVRAPYNFVPFSSKVLVRYENAEQLPPHDRIDPTLKTGEIHVTIKAETPIFVSDGKKQNADFFRNAEGKCTIPGSSVRGLLRQNMMILGYGLPRIGEDLDDYQIYYRDMTSARNSVAEDRREYYKATLNIVTEKHNQKPVTVAKNVQAGYLHRKNGEYYIQPIEGDVLRVPRSHEGLRQFPNQDASTCPVSYTASADGVKEIKPAGTAGMRSGVLLYTGKAVGQKVNPVYLFPQEDPNQAAIRLNEKDLLSYEMDYKNRVNSLKAYYDATFWALPEEGEEKPVFYCVQDGHVYLGMTRFLRIGYKHSLSEGMPKKHGELDPMTLDYPSAIFGYARKAGEKQQAYRSRVSVGDFVLQGNAVQMQAIPTVLGEPKPSYYPGYVVDGKDYNQDDFRLRGYKQYWMKQAQAKQPANQNEKIQTKLKPLKEGSTFHGVIRYKNLSDDELGLLLWTLKLEEGCCQSIGMGKPYGYGRVTVSVDKLTRLDWESLYTAQGFCGGNRDETGEVDRYINCYERYAAERLDLKKGKKRASIRSQREIADFFFMKKTIQEPELVSYMELEEYKKVYTPLPDVTKLRKEKEESDRKKAEQEADPMEKLLALYGTKHKKGR